MSADDAQILRKIVDLDQTSLEYELRDPQTAKSDAIALGFGEENK